MQPPKQSSADYLDELRDAAREEAPRRRDAGVYPEGNLLNALAPAGAVPPTDAQLRELWRRCTGWVAAHGVSGAEAIMQVDSVQEALPDLAEAVCGVVGYAAPEGR